MVLNLKNLRPNLLKYNFINTYTFISKTVKKPNKFKYIKYTKLYPHKLYIRRFIKY